MSYAKRIIDHAKYKMMAGKVAKKDPKPMPHNTYRNWPNDKSYFASQKPKPTPLQKWELEISEWEIFLYPILLGALILLIG